MGTETLQTFFAICLCGPSGFEPSAKRYEEAGQWDLTNRGKRAAFGSPGVSLPTVIEAD